jgi:LPS sulfotransferase NodH
VIVAAPRTGSNVLAASIASDLESLPWHIPQQPGLGHRCFYEPDEDPSIWSAYQSAMAHEDTQFVVKIMSTQAQLYQDLLSGHCYKIRLYRTDIVAQIASFYIADQTDIWYQRPKDRREDYSCGIHTERLAQAVDVITRSNDCLRQSAVNFDITISYESLGEIDSAWNARTHAPDNLDDLRATIAEILDSKQLPHVLHIS